METVSADALRIPFSRFAWEMAHIGPHGLPQRPGDESAGSILISWIIKQSIDCAILLQLHARLWQSVLEGSLVVCLYRDETLPVHVYMQQTFENAKGYGKRLVELKEWHTTAMHHSFVANELLAQMIFIFYLNAEHWYTAKRENICATCSGN